MQQLDQLIAPERNGGWERNAARKLGRLKSIQDLIIGLTDKDANVRIVAARALGRSKSLLTETDRSAVLNALVNRLEDRATNEFDYGGLQSEDAELECVSQTAAFTLVSLGYAESLREAYQKAKVPMTKPDKYTISNIRSNYSAHQEFTSWLVHSSQLPLA